MRTERISVQLVAMSVTVSELAKLVAAWLPGAGSVPIALRAWSRCQPVTPHNSSKITDRYRREPRR